MKKGFTLVELLIGAMIGVMILVSVYIAFSAATKYWSKSNSATSATQTARYALDHMSRNLKLAVLDSGIYYTITNTVNGNNVVQDLKFKKSGENYSHYRYDSSTGIIYYSQNSDSNYQPLTGTSYTNDNNVIKIMHTDNGSNIGIFSADGSTWIADSTPSIVYIDFIAQDSSTQSTKQTAGNAPEIEIRTAVTYPHF